MGGAAVRQPLRRSGSSSCASAPPSRAWVSRAVPPWSSATQPTMASPVPVLVLVLATPVTRRWRKKL